MLNSRSVVPVGEESDLVSRHVERSSGILLGLVSRSPGMKGGISRSMSFRWYYPDQVRRYFSDQLTCSARPQAYFKAKSQRDMVTTWPIMEQEGRYREETVEHPDAFF